MAHGSLQNVLAAGSRQAHADEPKVGDGATIVLWSDRQPATITEVLSPTHIVIREDRVTRWERDGSAYEMTRAYGGPIHVRRGKDGRWAISGQRSVTVMLGVRDAYRDSTF